MKKTTRTIDCGELKALVDALEPGDAIVTKNAGIATAAIRYFTKSPFTHVEAYAGRIEGVPLLVGAGPVFAGVFSKVRVVPLESLSADFVVMRPVGFGDAERSFIVRFMLSQLEASYGYSEYIPIAYRIILRKLNERFGTTYNIPTKDSAPGEWVCSELYAAGCDAMSEIFNGDGAFFGVPPINVYPFRIACDYVKMRNVAECVNGSVSVY
jgi:hypothetical protein